MTHGIVLAVCLILLVYIYNEKLFFSLPSSPSLKGESSKGLEDSSESLNEKPRSSWVPNASTAFVFVPLFAMQIVMAMAHALVIIMHYNKHPSRFAFLLKESFLFPFLLAKIFPSAPANSFILARITYAGMAKPLRLTGIGVYIWCWCAISFSL